jgi:hypothetical protein
MPDPTPPTIERGRDLLSRNAALASRLNSLGAWGSATAASLARTGTPPPDAFVHELGEACRAFAALRAEVLAAAGAAGATVPPADTLGSTGHLEGVLRALIDGLQQEERRAALTQARARTRAVLDRVDALVHRDDPGFSGLVLCQKRAGELRAVLDAPPGADLDGERAATIEATAPFTALLTLLDGARGVDDEQWAALTDAVADAFGRPLAAAAGRGRLQPR